jgi:hypothetical protein
MNIRKVASSILLGAVVGLGPLAMSHSSAAPPCNGCVGNADEKSPKGQSDGDKNKGYECDANHGIGRGNPAHSGECEVNG